MVDFKKQFSENGWAIYLPAVSAVYSNHIGEQRFNKFVDPARLPFPTEKLNFINKTDGAFYYPWALYSAGHAKIKLDKNGNTPASEDIWINRDKDTLVLGDSGGFQIAMGKWVAEWNNINCPKAANYRETVLKWLERTSDYAMVLDVPTWGPNMSYDIAVAGTKINNNYFMKHSTGECKFLNVLQGDKTHTKNSIAWYNDMKDYCDPKKYSNHFEGWSFAGSNARASRQILLRLIDIIHDDLLQKGKHDWIHILGYSTMEWAVMLTAIQRALRKHVNSDVTISFDSASPFIQVSKASVYSHTNLTDGGKWSYGSVNGIDDKNYSYRANATLANQPYQGGKNNLLFADSPISKMLKMGDICWYADGEENKLGKVGKSSWDTYSYILQMGHNTYHHIKGVLDANTAYDAGQRPKGLLDNSHRHLVLEDIVDVILSAESKQKALNYMQDYDRYIRSIQDNSFAPKDITDHHLDADVAADMNKDKTFMPGKTRKQHLKNNTNEKWF